MTDLTTLTPVEIDTVLAANWNEQARYRTYALEETRRIDNPPRWMTEREIVEAQGRLATYLAKGAALRAEAAPYEAEYRRRGGWNRYFLVTNSNGHVHRGMDCTTCFDTTEYAWIVDLADCDEDVMVVEYGEQACTVCFPNAPANPAFNGPGRRDAAAKAQRAAEKAEREAKKAAKAITDIDGSPLRIPRWRNRDGRISYDTLATKVAARNALSQAVQNRVWYAARENDPATSSQAQIDVLVPALEAAGIDTAKVIANAEKKARRDA